MTINSQIDQSNKQLRISISGNFDFASHAEFRKAYIDADSSLSVIIDMRTTEYMDSAALGMLLLLEEHFPGKKIQLINTNEFIRKVLEIANFDKKFSIS